MFLYLLFTVPDGVKIFASIPSNVYQMYSIIIHIL